MRPLLAALAFASMPALAASGPLHILVEDAASPFSEPDGTGYANEVVKAAFKEAGVNVLLEVVPYARCKAYVLKGLAAGCFSMSWDPSFAGHVKFADTPLFQVKPTYFQNVQRRIAASSEAQLGKGTVIGVVNGYEYPAAALRAKERGAVFSPARSEETNLKKLAVQRLDLALVMTNELQGTHFLPNAAGVSEQVEPVFASEQLNSYIGFSTHHPRGAWALAKFNEGMRLIIANGKLKAIWTQWQNKTQRQKHNE